MAACRRGGGRQICCLASFARGHGDAVLQLHVPHENKASGIRVTLMEFYCSLASELLGAQRWGGGQLCQGSGVGQGCLELRLCCSCTAVEVLCGITSSLQPFDSDITELDTDVRGCNYKNIINADESWAKTTLQIKKLKQTRWQSPASQPLVVLAADLQF